MKVKLRCFLFLAAVVMSPSSYSLGNSGWTTVSEIYQGTGVRPLIKLTNMGNAATGCTSSGYLRFKDVTTEVGKRFFSTLLAAGASGKKVNIKTAECSSDYAYIKDLQVRF